MFGIGGERDLSERELPHLAGLAGQPAGPGRTTARGPSASSMCTASCSAPPSGWSTSWASLDPVTQQFLAAAADTAASRWTEKDQGIWEIRGEPRDFLYSKLMCWVALDRAIALAPQLGAEDKVAGLDGGPGPDPRGHPRARVEREGGRLHPGLRQRRP